MVDGVDTGLPFSVQLAVKPAVTKTLVKSVLAPVQKDTALSAPNDGVGLTVRLYNAVSLQPSLLVAISRYTAANVTAVGAVTVAPLTAQLVVKPVVTNCVVRSTALRAQIVLDLSTPKFGFGAMVMVTCALSLQPALLVAINS